MAAHQVVMLGELEAIVAGELIGVACVLVLLVAVEAVPVVLLNGRCALVNVIAGTLVTFKEHFLMKILRQIYGIYRSSPP